MVRSLTKSAKEKQKAVCSQSKEARKKQGEAGEYVFDGKGTIHEYAVLVGRRCQEKGGEFGKGQGCCS